MFTIMKEYQVDNHPMTSKYRHACVSWYRKRHVSLMDGLPFDIDTNPKPPKDWDERIAQTKQSFMRNTENLQGGMKNAGGAIKENSIIVGTVISENAQKAGAVISEKGSLLKEKIQQKEFGKKIMSMFGKKK